MVQWALIASFSKYLLKLKYLIQAATVLENTECTILQILPSMHRNPFLTELCCDSGGWLIRPCYMGNCQLGFGDEPKTLKKLDKLQSPGLLLPLYCPYIIWLYFHILAAIGRTSWILWIIIRFLNEFSVVLGIYSDAISNYQKPSASKLSKAKTLL